MSAMAQRWAPPVASPLEALLAVQELNEQLGQGAKLREWADRVGALCRMRRCRALYAASPPGERLVAATLVAYPDEFRGHRVGDEDDRVALIDGFCVTLLGMANTVALLNHVGVPAVHGIVLDLIARRSDDLFGMMTIDVVGELGQHQGDLVGSLSA